MMSEKRPEPAREPVPPPIPATAEDLARAAMLGPPKETWRYLKGERQKRPARKSS